MDTPSKAGRRVASASEVHECDECGHAAHSKACEVERGDQFVEGQNGGAYMAQGPCGCTEVTEDGQVSV